MIEVSLLSIMISILLLGVSAGHNLSWGDPVSDFCYDEVGDNQFCFNNEKDCIKAQRDNQIVESHCYKEVS
jgi:hypothetical protein